MQKTVVPLREKGTLARKKCKLASEKGNMGWEKMARSPVVLGPKPKMDAPNEVCKLQSYHFHTEAL